MKKIFYKTIIFITKIFFKLFYRYRLYGANHYLNGGAIIASNHTSYYDPPILAISCKEEVHFLAKKELFFPVFGFIIKNLNSHPVSKKENLKSIKYITKLLKEGKKVIMFPEGERSFDNKIGNIQQGIGVLISRSGANIIPAYIDGAFEAWKRKKTLPKLFVKITCVFGSPIKWREFSHLPTAEAKKQLLQKLKSSIINLRTWLKDGAKGTPP